MPQKRLVPHLTKRERETLQLILQGMPMDRVSKTLHQSPKVVERYVHQGLYKLENWSQEAAPGPSYHSAGDREMGFLRPREAERTIARIVRVVGSNWFCLVLLAIPDKMHSRNSDMVSDAIGHHIHLRLRGADIVTKWSATEWVMFLPRITSVHIDNVVQRLQHGHLSPSTVYIAARQPQNGESFNEVATQCHHQLLAQYVDEDLAAYVKSLID